MPTVRMEDTTLRLWLWMHGYSTQAAVLRAASDAGLELAQCALSDMCRGDRAYPKARDALIETCWRPKTARERAKAERQLDLLIDNARRKTE